ncbi:unnamed protein product, partial [Ostreobium quekettii]
MPYELLRTFYAKAEDFKFEEAILENKVCTVYRARCAYSNGAVNLKSYKNLTDNVKRRVLQEIRLAQAGCPFIQRCFDAFEDKYQWWVVLEHCAGGTLLDVLRRIGRVDNEGWLASQVIHLILQTLSYLHGESIIHRAITAQNVHFNSNKVLKLGGLYFCVDTSFGPATDVVGSVDYLAPEIPQCLRAGHGQNPK